MDRTTVSVSPSTLSTGDRFLDLADIEHTVTGAPTYERDSEEFGVPTTRGTVWLADYRDVRKVKD